MADREDKLLNSLREEQEELLRDHKLMQSLVDHKGWQRLKMILQQQIRGLREEDFTSQIEGMEDAFRSANRKARIAGLQVAMATPITMVEELVNDLETIGTQIEEAQDG